MCCHGVQTHKTLLKHSLFGFTDVAGLSLFSPQRRISSLLFALLCRSLVLCELIQCRLQQSTHQIRGPSWEREREREIKEERESERVIYVWRCGWPVASTVCVCVLVCWCQYGIWSLVCVCVWFQQIYTRWCETMQVMYVNVCAFVCHSHRQLHQPMPPAGSIHRGRSARPMPARAEPKSP